MRQVCSLSGEIAKLAYISPKEYCFDRREKSVVCTASSDGTVRAWHVREVSGLEGVRMNTEYLQSHLAITGDF